MLPALEELFLGVLLAISAPLVTRLEGRPRGLLRPHPLPLRTGSTVVAPGAQRRRQGWEGRGLDAELAVGRVGPRGRRAASESASSSLRRNDSTVCVWAGHRRRWARGAARPAACGAGTSPGRGGIQGQRQRGARVLLGAGATAGLVVDDDELGAVDARPLVDAVDAAVEHQAVGAHRDGALDPARLVVRVDVAEVGLHLATDAGAPPAALVVVAEAGLDPRLAQQGRASGCRPLTARQVPPVAQRVVRGQADRGMRALRPGGRTRPVEVLEPVAARALEVGQETAGRRRIQRRGHALEHALRRRRCRHARTVPSRTDAGRGFVHRGQAPSVTKDWTALATIWTAIAESSSPAMRVASTVPDSPSTRRTTVANRRKR